MLSDNPLTKLTDATRMLAEARTLDEVKSIKDIATAAAAYAHARGLGEEAEAYAAEIRLEASRRIGQFLQKAKDAGEIDRGGRPSENQSHNGTSFGLSDIGISKNESSASQTLADVPDDEWPEIKQQAAQRKQTERTVAQKIRRKHSDTPATPELPDDKYRIVYADPPWSYGNTMPPGTTQPDDYYPLMSTPDIAALPIQNIVEDNAVLFLWTTSPHLEESFAVIHGWGFKYKTSFVWDKVKHNMGHYNSVRHELLLVCTRGSCMPDVKKLFDSVQTIERTAHSVKPEMFREIIETLYTHGKRVELFARSQHEGWEAWGNESGS